MASAVETTPQSATTLCRTIALPFVIPSEARDLQSADLSWKRLLYFQLTASCQRI
jgi:hypothetical protein